MKVIVNADDMGMSDEVNQSIIKLHQKGVVSSTSLMANGPRFNEALELLSQEPELGVGVHLCLDGNYNSARDYVSLLDPANNTFYNKEEAISRIRRSAFDKDEIYREFSLQIEKILDHGIRVSQLDTHHHLHLYFPVLSQVIRVAKKYKISYIRSQRLSSCLSKGYLNNLYRYMHHLYLNMQLNSVQGYYDPEIENCSGNETNFTRLEKMLASGRGIMEIMLHPVGEDDPETSFFSSQEVQQLLSRHTILNYSQLSSFPNHSGARVAPKSA